MKKDVPLELARYIREKVLDKKRGGFCNTWAQKTLKGYNRRIRGIYRTYNVTIIDKPRRATTNKKRMSRNQRNLKKKRNEKFGILIPNTTRDVLLMDTENKKMLWADSILKEMTALNRLNCFKYYKKGKKFSKSEGW